MTAFLAASTPATNGFPVQIKQLITPLFFVRGVSGKVTIQKRQNLFQGQGGFGVERTLLSQQQLETPLSLTIRQVGITLL